MFEFSFIILLIILICAMLWLCIKLCEHQNIFHLNYSNFDDDNHYIIYNSDGESGQELISIPDDTST